MDLHIQQLSKHYASVSALDSVSLDIASGELVALLGPSGSGKTTLLRVVAGLLNPDAGSVLFGTTDATALSLRERNVGFVFQHYALFRHMTVGENIAFGLRSRRRRDRPDKTTIRRRIDDLLALIQLPEYSRRYPEQLSGGQKQRVALARALAIDPTVLLLDEPFGALDAKVRVELRRWLRRLHDKTGQTTVFVTHDQEEALELADRVVVMREGRIEQIGTPHDIYRRPSSPFVYEFIGRTNCLSGNYDNGHFEADGCQVRWPIDRAGAGPGRLYVRPHDLLLTGPDEGHPAEVRAAHSRSDRTTLELQLGGQAQPVELDLAATSESIIPAVGANVFVKPLDCRVYPI